MMLITKGDRNWMRVLRQGKHY